MWKLIFPITDNASILLLAIGLVRYFRSASNSNPSWLPNMIIKATLTAPTIQKPSRNQMDKVCSSYRDAAFTYSSLLYSVYDHSKTHAISHRHLTDGTGASEVGLLSNLDRALKRHALSVTVIREFSDASRPSGRLGAAAPPSPLTCL